MYNIKKITEKLETRAAVEQRLAEVNEALMETQALIDALLPWLEKKEIEARKKKKPSEKIMNELLAMKSRYEKLEKELEIIQFERKILMKKKAEFPALEYQVKQTTRRATLKKELSELNTLYEEIRKVEIDINGLQHIRELVKNALVKMEGAKQLIEHSLQQLNSSPHDVKIIDAYHLTLRKNALAHLSVVVDQLKVAHEKCHEYKEVAYLSKVEELLLSTFTALEKERELQPILSGLTKSQMVDAFNLIHFQKLRLNKAIHEIDTKIKMKDLSKSYLEERRKLLLKIING